jgi:WD40 repeat protein
MFRVRWIVALPVAVSSLFGLANGEPPVTAKTFEDPLPPAAAVRLGSSRLWHGPSVFELIFSPDGKYLFSAAGDPTIRLWEASTGKEVRAFQGHEGKVSAIALRGDGRVLASAGEDRTVRLWDVATGSELRRWTRSEVCLALRWRMLAHYY